MTEKLYFPIAMSSFKMQSGADIHGFADSVGGQDIIADLHLLQKGYIASVAPKLENDCPRMIPLGFLQYEFSVTIPN